MSKEEILKGYKPNSEYPSYYHEINILEAMDEYAKIKAIEFKKWCDENEGVQVYAKGKSLTNEELYEMFSK